MGASEVRMDSDEQADHALSGGADEGGPSLADLVDVPMLQSMMDDFYVLTHIPMSLVDIDGGVVLGAG